jgi:hypothetical protein
VAVLPGALTAFGGACEFVGLGLVVREIVDDRRQARILFVAKRSPTRPRRRYPGKALPRSARLLPSTPMAMSQAEQQRVLTQVLHNLDAAAYNALIEMRKALDSQLDNSVGELAR